ncbi:MAG TPA: hypothetical protein VIH61_03130 [Waddliaceae bacterium]
MTFFLPQDHSLFRKAFDETCDRILQSDQDEVFYALFVQLIANLREHSLLKTLIGQAETSSLENQKEFRRIALEVLEYNWKKLWQYHCRSYHHRKRLARIKRIVTSPTEISFSSLYHRATSNMWEFRFYSPFFRCLETASSIYRKAQSELRFYMNPIKGKISPSKEGTVILQKIVPLKLTKRDKQRRLSLKIINSTNQEGPSQFIWPVEKISSLFSPLTKEIENKFELLGQNNDKKRRNMEIMVETNFSYCWDRLRFLEECYKSPSNFVQFKRFPGKWTSISKLAWESAFERCEKEALVGAKMSLQQKLASKPNSSIDVFLGCEHQIERKDYEKYLSSLKNHIHAYLCTLEQEKQKIEAVSTLVPSGTQKAHFVIDLALKYWKSHPEAKHNDVFEYYQCNCPITHQLGKDRWAQIIREKKLDPRSKKEKRRGSGKKTSKI